MISQSSSELVFKKLTRTVIKQIIKLVKKKFKWMPEKMSLVTGKIIVYNKEYVE